MYIERHAEKTIEQLSKIFGAVLVAGPRQVGKTTMLDKLTGGINKVTLDYPIIRAGAEEESGTLYPLEMKKHAAPSKKGYRCFQCSGQNPGYKARSRRCYLPI